MKLSTQITLIFLVAFVITTSMLGLFLTRSLNGIFEDTVYSSLEAEGKTVRLHLNTDTYTPAENTGFIRFTADGGEYVASDNIGEYVDEESIRLLGRKVALQKDTSVRYVNNIDGKPIYYIILKYRGFFEILDEENILVLTDSTMKNQLVGSTFTKLFLYCFVAFLIGYLIILVWTRFLLGSIRKIRNGIVEMGTNHYETQIASGRRDELGQLVDSVNGMSRQIVRNEQIKREMIQGISHDLKTPIAVIQSYAEAVQDGISDPETAAGITLKQTKRLTEKVTNLLNLTRLDHIGSHTDLTSRVRLDTLISELVKSYTYQTNVEIVLNLDEVSFTGEAESWRIAVENILDNAIRYAKSKIEITLADGRLSIYNDGKHISPESIDTIFNMYEKSRDGKFGLGLSIVHKTVTLFGYRIEVINRDAGVEFLITG